MPCAVLTLLARLAKPMNTVSSTIAAGPSRSSRRAYNSSATVVGVLVMASAYSSTSRSSGVNTSDSRQRGTRLALARSRLWLVAAEEVTGGHQREPTWPATAMCANVLRLASAASHLATSAENTWLNMATLGLLYITSTGSGTTPSCLIMLSLSSAGSSTFGTRSAMVSSLDVCLSA